MRCRGLVIGILSQRFRLLTAVRVPGNHVPGGNGNSLNNALDGFALERNLVNNLDEWKVVDDIPRRNELIGVFGGNGPLEFLAVEKIGLDLVPQARALLGVDVIAGPGKGLGALAVPTTVTGRNEVGHATGFRKGIVPDPVKEHVAKLGHLSEAHPQQGGLGVPPEADPVDESRPQGNHVLEGPADLGTGHVRNVLDPKVRRAVKELPGHLVGGGTKVGGKGGLAHLSLGDLRGHVSAHEDAAGKVVSHGFGNAPGDEDGRSRLFAKV